MEAGTRGSPPILMIWIARWNGARTCLLQRSRSAGRRAHSSLSGNWRSTPSSASATPNAAGCFPGTDGDPGRRCRSCQQGDDSDAMYFLESGRVDVLAGGGRRGGKLRLRSMTAGAVIGEVGFYLGKARSASIVVTEAGVLQRLEPRGAASNGREGAADGFGDSRSHRQLAVGSAVDDQSSGAGIDGLRAVGAIEIAGSRYHARVARDIAIFEMQLMQHWFTTKERSVGARKLHWRAYQYRYSETISAC